MPQTLLAKYHGVIVRCLWRNGDRGPQLDQQSRCGELAPQLSSGSRQRLPVPSQSKQRLRLGYRDGRALRFKQHVEGKQLDSWPVSERSPGVGSAGTEIRNHDCSDRGRLLRTSGP
jgi:hypothetical protein